MILDIAPSLALSSVLLVASPLLSCDEARRPGHHQAAISHTASRHDTPLPATPPPDSASYNDALLRIEARREALAARYTCARTAEERAAVLDSARGLMLASLRDEIFPFWYGTPWDFNGTTETPGRGKIACGYFVTTVLRDAGLHLARTKLAQQASEAIIQSLTTSRNIQRFSNVGIEEFVAAIRRWGPGVYVVGLDIHTGFIVATDDDVYFVHASYLPPRMVVEEIAVESRILTGSRYRVLGKISADDDLMMKWLLKRKV